MFCQIALVLRRICNQFWFCYVLQNASQETTYDVVAADIVQSVLEGYNGIYFFLLHLLILLFPYSHRFY
jgi:hypothetical protein